MIENTKCKSCDIEMKTLTGGNGHGVWYEWCHKCGQVRVSAIKDIVDGKEVIDEKWYTVDTPMVKLTAYQWHILLREFEHLLRICNRDNSTTEKLYDEIATQLNRKDI